MDNWRSDKFRLRDLRLMKALRLGFGAMLLSALWSGLWTSSAAAQERGALAASCGLGASAEGARACAEAVLAIETLRAGVALSLSQGADVPGFASTVGLGEGGLPKISTSVRFALTHLTFPVLTGSRQLPAESGTLNVSSVLGTVGIGVFNGFSGPGTLRGVLSLDLLGSVGLSMLPKSDGFRGTAFALGYGVRLGLLREGFSNPGVALSIMRRDFTDDVLYGTPTDDTQLRFDPGTTSVRLTVGRDYFPAGFILGGGFDWYDGDVSLTMRGRSDGGGPANVSAANFTSRRATVFAGGQYTYLIVQASLEVGWANGFGSIEGYTGPFHASASTYFGSLALRLTL